jgi:plasmid stabilization system protein ParE
MSIAWTEPALTDLEAIHSAIARDSEPFASRVLERLMDSLERAIPVPRLGRVVAELGDERVRELIFQTFRIVYRVDSGRLVVLSVLHGGRDDRREPRRWEVY